MDIPVLIALAAAFGWGMEHAFEPDHLVAVSTIVSHSRSLLRSVITGSVWGIGHTISLLLLGILVILFKVKLIPESSTIFDLIVGVMLVALGFWSIRRARKFSVHYHTHEHEGKVHAHLHSHRNNTSHSHTHIAFPVGLIHGLAGSGVIVLLTMSTMGSVPQGILFIVVFGAGVVLSMSLIASALSVPIALGGGHKNLRAWIYPTVAGTASLLLGSFLVLQFVLSPT